MKNNIKCLELFCGAGGFSKGFEKADLNVILGIDSNEIALQTYNYNNNSDCVNYNLRKNIIIQNNSNIDIVFGSPPCKGFSYAQGKRSEKDKRNNLVFHYIKYLEEIEPEISVIENVIGMKNISDNFFDDVLERLDELGYTNSVLEIDCSNYGVPQSRKRLFIISSKSGQNFDKSYLGNSTTNVKQAIGDLPDIGEDKTKNNNSDIKSDYDKFVKDNPESLYNHNAKKLNNKFARTIVKKLDKGQTYRSNRNGDKYRSVWDVFVDEFTEKEKSILQFLSENRSKKDYRIKGKTVGPVDRSKLLEEVNYDNLEKHINKLYNNDWIRIDYNNKKIGYDINTKSGVRPKYTRLPLNSPSNTILTTDFNPREKIHPTKKRGLSLREGARLQSFPDSYKFKGSFKQISNQIGNAVPPFISYKIGKMIKNKI
jgi:DNA (cytosine-5)-methyltransferase 1